MNNVIFLMGPTASGKTDFACQLSEEISVDLISVDSALVYKNMDIGTAKPDKSTLRKYPHKLIDIINPEENYSVASFSNDAKNEIQQSIKNNKTPLLVGGTSFYFKALEEGLSPLPESQPELREKLNQTLNEKGLDYLHKELQKIDPIALEKINKNDTQRILRALEVFYISGKTLTQGQQEPKVNAIKNPIKKIILLPERKILHQRIEQRFLDMVENSFIDEVKKLKENPKLNADLPAIRCVGYRQIWQYLEGKINYDEMIERGIIATRQLCKRQTTWLKKEQNALILKEPDLQKTLDFLSC
ncbi:tRNA dimethylallyltransferase [hydrothermal vent metagenome]|uniref:tRNA dimethylallyltransferase n=1 Tax=hydrothermal vent metagenome TaxID=652676 RepID=A0A1W1CGV0_9ZZZZ